VANVIVSSIALGVVIGITLGLLGGGGSTLTVPMLAFIAGLDIRHAITTSLVVVGVTSVIGAVAHARAGRVQWRPALLLGLTGMAGAYVGGRLAQHVPGRIAMVAFAAIMIVSAIALLRERSNTATGAEFDLPVVKTVLLGVAVGVVSGLTGAGGGFLLVAALTLFCGLTMPVAVGTSLVVIAMHCFAALAGRLDGEHIDWRLATMVTTAAVIGSLIGERLTAMIDPHGLRTMFGWFVLLMASGILGRETSPLLGAVTALTLIAAGLHMMWRRPRAVGGADWLAVPQMRRLRLFEPVRNPRALRRLGQRSWPYKPSLSRRQNPREGRAEA
jgi:uncharacterized membrane protein YfcA